MSIETDLWDYLDANVAGVYFSLTMAPPSARAPLVEITMTDHDRTRTTDVTSANTQTTFDVECWDTSSVSAASLCATVSGLLEDYSGTMGATRIFRSRIFNEFSGSDQAAELYNRTFSIIFTHA